MGGIEPCICLPAIAVTTEKIKNGKLRVYMSNCWRRYGREYFNVVLTSYLAGLSRAFVMAYLIRVKPLLLGILEPVNNSV